MSGGIYTVVRVHAVLNLITSVFVQYTERRGVTKTRLCCIQMSSLSST